MKIQWRSLVMNDLGLIIQACRRSKRARFSKSISRSSLVMGRCHMPRVSTRNAALVTERAGCLPRLESSTALIPQMLSKLPEPICRRVEM